MALKKNINLDSTMDMLNGISDQVKESKQKQREPEKSFKKPGSDYYRLDLVVRGTKQSKVSYELNGKRVETTKPISTEEIVKDYKDYISTMAAAEGISITKYIHKLIDMDMYVHRTDYKRIKKAQGK